jgi:hypothetical protein
MGWMIGWQANLCHIRITHNRCKWLVDFVGSTSGNFKKCGQSVSFEALFTAWRRPARSLATPM